jgi:hypothetical protein
MLPLLVIIGLGSCGRTVELSYSIGQSIKNETSSSLRLVYWREKKILYSRMVKPNATIDTIFTTEGLVGFIPIDPNASIDSATVIIDDKMYLSFKKIVGSDCLKNKNIFCADYYEEKIVTEYKKNYTYKITTDDLKSAKKL